MTDVKPDCDVLEVDDGLIRASGDSSASNAISVSAVVDAAEG